MKHGNRSDAQARPVTGGDVAAVLVVEDEWLLAHELALGLAEEGLHVIGPASHTGEALELIAASRVDAALLDVTLGSGDSFEIAAALDRHAVPFLFMTGWEHSPLPPHLGERLTLIKPLTRPRLRQAVQALLDSGARCAPAPTLHF